MRATLARVGHGGARGQVVAAAMLMAMFVFDSVRFGPGPLVPHPLLWELYPPEPRSELF